MLFLITKIVSFNYFACICFLLFTITLIFDNFVVFIRNSNDFIKFCALPLSLNESMMVLRVSKLVFFKNRHSLI